jgi:hypothetical protein
VLGAACTGPEVVYLALMMAAHEPSVALWRYLFWAGMPLCVFKQYANVVQLREACDKIVASDEADKGK